MRCDAVAGKFHGIKAISLLRTRKEAGKITAFMPPGFLRQRYPALPFMIMASLSSAGFFEQPCLQQDLDHC